ncbi:efflux RND transporter periplasmic adaptor subunit [Blautia sp.]|uniref:efflux RND transporter periplasmic adaptor subunit n=1 Tax=Blautia sp. TaxID=1955243 RepID=UPI003A8F09EA
MKKRILILLGILIIGGGAAGVCWKMGIIGNQQQTSGDAVYVTKISDLTDQTSGVSNRYAGVVEPQETVSVELESGRTVKEVKVKTGDQVKKGQLLFEYDLSSIQESLEEAQLDLDRLKNEASSLTEQIATLEKEKKQATQDNQLSYTIEIETNKMNLKKNEYSQKSKQAEIDKLQSATGNTEVRSSIDGVIQKIDTSKLTSDDNSSVDDSADDSDMSYSSDSSSGGNAFITILSTGAYRIKGTVNEMNVQNIIEGDPVIIRSRVDSSQTWKGTMGTIDRESATSSNSSSSFGMMDSSGDSQTSTSTYPFYVNLDSSDGLMLGQHVYIEMDEGQDTQKTGVWISEAYIVDADTDSPYVWAADKDDKLEKRSVILGQYDEELGEYEIADGLTKDDSIAFPSDVLEEGMATTTNIEEAMDTSTVDMQPVDELGADNLDADNLGADNLDGEDAYVTDDFSDSEDDWNADEWSADDEYESDGESTVIDDPDAMGDVVSDDDSDGVSVPMDEDLVPVQGDTEDAE